MKIFVQNPVVAGLKEWSDVDLLDGVVLSPVDLAVDDPAVTVVDRLAEIAVDFGVPVCVPVSAINGADIYREARELAHASEHAIVQIPFVEDAVAPMRKLVADGIKVCATHVYSGAQAFIAAKLGASMIAIRPSPFASRVMCRSGAGNRLPASDEARSGHSTKRSAASEK